MSDLERAYEAARKAIAAKFVDVGATSGDAKVIVDAFLTVLGIEPNDLAARREIVGIDDHTLELVVEPLDSTEPEFVDTFKNDYWLVQVRPLWPTITDGYQEWVCCGRGPECILEVVRPPSNSGNSTPRNGTIIPDGDGSQTGGMSNEHT